MKKKITCLAMSLLMVSSLGLTACGGMGGVPDDQGGSIKEGTTVLRVANYFGGLGEEWIKEAARDFEEFYANESFEDGKMGVSVDVQSNKDYNGKEALDKMSGYTHDVFVTQTVNYYDHINRGNFADLTTAITTPLTEYGESKSITDKLDPSFQTYLSKKDGKYYAVPYFDGIYSLTYDVQLFDDNALFFDNEGNIGVKLDAENIGAGPDGDIETTYDNGLPQTFAQFEELLTEIRGLSIVPLSFSPHTYVMRMAMGIWADYEGFDKMNVNYTFDGEIEYVTNISGTGYDAELTTATETITPGASGNGALLQKQAGKYYGLSFMKDIILANSSNYENSTSDFRGQQKNYIKGNLSDEFTTYAMHVDGTWWENEADADFASLAQVFDNASRKERKFAFMPLPKVDETRLGAPTLFSSEDSFIFVNSYTDKLDLATKFFRFLHTDAQLSQFTRYTSVTRSLNYDVSQADYELMSNYGRSVLEVKKHADIVYPYSAETFFINNTATFEYQKWAWESVIDRTPYTNPFTTFIKYKNISVADYFEGLYDNFSNSWKNMN